MAVTLTLPPIHVPVVDKQSGRCDEAWYRYFELIRAKMGGDVDNIESNANAAFTAQQLADANTASIVSLALTKANQTDLNVQILRVDDAEAGIAALQAITFVAGNGIDGGGDLGDASITFDAKKDTGWTAATGTANKGAYASYAGQTTSVAYVQAEAQATDDAVKGVSRRMVAIEAALRLNEAIN